VKFLTVRDLRNKSAAVWRDLAVEKEMVVTSSGRPVAILSAVSEASLEESLRVMRQARAIQAVADLQRESVREATDRITDEEIEAEIRSVRRTRTR
jgi:antitoxin (DNA-binding transcriptional repressor) of toxin-antitoxin stability system